MPTSGLQVLAVPHRRCLQRVLADRWCASLKNPKPSNPRMTENDRKWQKMGFYTSLNMNEKGSLLTKWSHSLMSRAPFCLNGFLYFPEHEWEGLPFTKWSPSLISRAPFCMSRAPFLRGALFRAYSTSILDGGDRTRHQRCDLHRPSPRFPHLASLIFGSS